MIIGIITIMAKVYLWPWGGGFLIAGYTSISMIFFSFSWFIFSNKIENSKRQFFIYGTIPLGIAIGTFIISPIPKLQHWPWHREANLLTLFLFLITGIIFISALILTKNEIKKEYIKSILIRILIFSLITLTTRILNLDQIISFMSTPETNLKREILEKKR